MRSLLELIKWTTKTALYLTSGHSKQFKSRFYSIIIIELKIENMCWFGGELTIGLNSLQTNNIQLNFIIQY